MERWLANIDKVFKTDGLSSQLIEDKVDNL